MLLNVSYTNNIIISIVNPSLLVVDVASRNNFYTYFYDPSAIGKLESDITFMGPVFLTIEPLDGHNIQPDGI